MDPTPRIWFDALEEISMKPFERQSHPITLTTTIAAVTFVVLVLASTSVRRADTTAYATNGAAVATATVAAAEDHGSAIRPFRVSVPEAALVDLRTRIAATRWPERETVADASQGVPLATMQELARYWATDYDWRKVEAKLNALPQFITEIDGLDIHFIHVRSKHENALPLIVTHGWPGSIIEQLKIIDPLDQSDRTWRRAPRTHSMS